MTTNFTAVAERLRSRAVTLALAHIAARRTDSAQRWRRAALLWPLFPKG